MRQKNKEPIPKLKMTWEELAKVWPQMREDGAVGKNYARMIQDNMDARGLAPMQPDNVTQTTNQEPNGTTARTVPRATSTGSAFVGVKTGVKQMDLSGNADNSSAGPDVHPEGRQHKHGHEKKEHEAAAASGRPLDIEMAHNTPTQGEFATSDHTEAESSKNVANPAAVPVAVVNPAAAVGARGSGGVHYNDIAREDGQDGGVNTQTKQGRDAVAEALHLRKQTGGPEPVDEQKGGADGGTDLPNAGADSVSGRGPQAVITPSGALHPETIAKMGRAQEAGASSVQIMNMVTATGAPPQMDAAGPQSVRQRPVSRDDVKKFTTALEMLVYDRQFGQEGEEGKVNIEQVLQAVPESADGESSLQDAVKLVQRWGLTINKAGMQILAAGLLMLAHAGRAHRSRIKRNLASAIKVADPNFSQGNVITSLLASVSRGVDYEPDDDDDDEEEPEGGDNVPEPPVNILDQPDGQLNDDVARTWLANMGITGQAAVAVMRRMNAGLGRIMETDKKLGYLGKIAGLALSYLAGRRRGDSQPPEEGGPPKPEPPGEGPPDVHARPFVPSAEVGPPPPPRKQLESTDSEIPGPGESCSARSRLLEGELRPLLPIAGGESVRLDPGENLRKKVSLATWQSMRGKNPNGSLYNNRLLRQNQWNWDLRMRDPMYITPAVEGPGYGLNSGVLASTGHDIRAFNTPAWDRKMSAALQRTSLQQKFGKRFHVDKFMRQQAELQAKQQIKSYENNDITFLVNPVTGGVHHPQENFNESNALSTPLINVEPPLAFKMTKEVLPAGIEAPRMSSVNALGKLYLGPINNSSVFVKRPVLWNQPSTNPLIQPPDNQKEDVIAQMRWDTNEPSKVQAGLVSEPVVQHSYLKRQTATIAVR
jgi:hypothetical protein